MFELDPLCHDGWRCDCSVCEDYEYNPVFKTVTAFNFSCEHLVDWNHYYDGINNV